MNEIPTPDRVSLLVTAATKDKRSYLLQGKSELIKQWSKELKAASTRASKVTKTATGIDAILGKLNALRFETSLLSEQETSTLLAASRILDNLASAAEVSLRKIQAAQKAAAEAEAKRTAEARSAFSKTIGRLGFDDQILIAAMRESSDSKIHQSYEFQHILGYLNDPAYQDYISFKERVTNWLDERNGALLRQLESDMERSNRSAIDLCEEALTRFEAMKPDIAQQWPNLPERINARLVQEQLEHSMSK